MSMRCSRLVLNPYSIPSGASEGESTTATVNPCSAKRCLDRTRKLFSNLPIVGVPDRLDSLRRPSPPAKRMTVATGWAGPIKIKRCPTPGRV